MSTVKALGHVFPSKLRPRLVHSECSESGLCLATHWTYRVIEERSIQMKKIHLHEDTDGLGVKTLKTLWAANSCLWVKRIHKRQFHSSKSLFQQRWTSTPLGWDDDALSEKFLEWKNYVCHQFGPLLIYTSCWCSVVQACSRKHCWTRRKRLRLIASMG